jgi:hypothetical protein
MKYWAESTLAENTAIAKAATITTGRCLLARVSIARHLSQLDWNEAQQRRVFRPTVDSTKMHIGAPATSEVRFSGHLRRASEVKFASSCRTGLPGS